MSNELPTSKTVTVLERLREVLGRIPVRHEPISGQMFSYIKRSEVFDWLDIAIEQERLAFETQPALSNLRLAFEKFCRGMCSPGADSSAWYWKIFQAGAEAVRPAHETTPVASKKRSLDKARLAIRLREWSTNCLIDGFHMDKGEPTLQVLLKEAVTLLLADETPTPLTASSLDTLIVEADKYILPVDVKIGAATFRKGVKVGTMLRGLKSHAERQIATAYSPEEPTRELPPDGTVDGDGTWHGGKWHPNPYRAQVNALALQCAQASAVVRSPPKATAPQPGDVLGTARMVYTGKLPPRKLDDEKAGGES